MTWAILLPGVSIFPIYTIHFTLQNIFQSAPESLGIMAASTAAGIPLGGAIGAGGGKTWIRNPNMNISTEGMRPESLNALDMLAKWFYDRTGKRLVVTAGTNGDHAGGFNPRGAKNILQESPAQENSYDNNFSSRQNEI